MFARSGPPQLGVVLVILTSRKVINFGNVIDVFNIRLHAFVYVQNCTFVGVQRSKNTLAVTLPPKLTEYIYNKLLFYNAQ